MTTAEKRDTGMVPSSPPHLEEAIPPGSLDGRWLIWSILAIAYFIALFHRVAPGVVADRLMAEFQVDGTVVGMLAAVYFYLYAAMQLPAGALADALGARKTVAGGTALAGLGSLAFALSPSVEAAFLGRFLVGIGVSVIFVAAMKFQVSWFRAAEFGTVSGLLILVGNLGSVVATSPVAWMSQALGWRASFLAMGVATCAVALTAWRWVRDHPREPGPSTTVLATPRPASINRRTLLASTRLVWKKRQTKAGFMVHFGIAGAFLTFTGMWGVPYLMHVYGMDRSAAANFLLVSSASIALSAPMLGYVSDRFLKKRRFPIVAMAALHSGCWLLLTFWGGGKPPEWFLWPLFGGLGLSTGIVSLVLTSVKEANAPATAGLAMGAANGGFLGAALLQPAVGYLLDNRWQGILLEGARVYPQDAYQIALVIVSGLSLIGLLGSVLMRESYGQVVSGE